MESETKAGQLDTRREELLKSLSPKEAAIFKFLEHLGKLEKQPRRKNDPKLKISWDGTSTEKIVNAALSGNTSLLPVPRENRYTTFEWHTRYDIDLDVRRQYKSREEYRAAFPSKGSSDIRIYSISDGSLRFFANRGSFKGMENDWAEAIDNIPYPIQVEDEYGFRYENSAYRKAKSG